MKKVSVWFFKNPPAGEDTMNFALLFLRIFAGLIMIPYGWGKIVRYDTLRENFFGDPIAIGHETSLIICILQQIFCSIMLVLGVQSRFAAFMLFTNMVVAVKFHFFDPFCAVKALPTVFMGIYLFLVISGGGRFSLDNLIFKNFREDRLPEANRHYALRVALMSLVFAGSWILMGNFLGIGGLASALCFVAIFMIFIISVYGIAPWNTTHGR